jgi:methylenetetrahydrofolate dehydrogenase (NADP+)/methenyltetrahydrofolate cyclohydrolase
MAARIIDGAKHAAELRAATERQVGLLAREHGLVPGLAVVLVGEDPASQIYVRNKVKVAAGVRVVSSEHRLPAGASEAEVLDKVTALNADPAIHGILVQMPLPPQIRPEPVIAAIDPLKDVDGFHDINAGRLMSGREGLVPCTPWGCILLLRQTLGALAGRSAIVLGRSNIVGKPMALLLLREDCTVTVAHSKTRDLPALCRGADILVAAIGRPEFVRGDWLKPGATVIDVGISRLERDGRRRLVGDVAFAEALGVAGAITPVPGGVGPMTIACLLANTVRAACLQRGIAVPAG